MDTNCGSAAHGPAPRRGREHSPRGTPALPAVRCDAVWCWAGRGRARRDELLLEAASGVHSVACHRGVGTWLHQQGGITAAGEVVTCGTPSGVTADRDGDGEECHRRADIVNPCLV